MKSTGFVGLATGLLFGWTIPSALCDETKKEQPTQVKPKPPELKVLEKLVGTWDSEVVGEVKLFWFADKGVAKTTNKYEWVLNGRFMQNTKRHTINDKEHAGVCFWTYDMSAKAYRGWIFAFASNVIEWKGQWDDESKRLRIELKTSDAPLNGVVVIGGINRMLDKDTFEWTLVGKGTSGDNWLDLKETHHRRGVNSKASSSENKASRNAESPLRPLELKHLDRYLGTWTTASVNKVAEWNPKEMRTTGTVTNEWVLDGQFMQQRGKESDGTEHIEMRGYDSQKKQVSLWHFDSQGSILSANGTWSEDARTMTWKADLGKGITSTNTVQFIGSDTIEWRMFARNDAGKVFVDNQGKFSRRK